jgi:hypothetical protein
MVNMPINIRLNDLKRPDFADLVSKINSDSLRTASIQPSTKKEATAARSILSKSASNRIERRNALFKKQTSRGGIARANNRIYRLQINLLAAERLL